jgi:LysR family transcriptional regulator, putative pyruvate carboxylase regulator
VNRAAVIQRLADKKDALVIMGLVPSDKALSSLPFLNNKLVPVVPVDHPLAKQKKVGLKEFLSSSLLLRELGPGSRLALEQHCQQ